VTATPPPIVIEPVADNEYMVLIADLEHLGGDQRNVKRFISEALRRHFEEDYPFARLRVREYPAVITTDEQAITIADEYQAAVMIWGSYDEDEIQLAVQIGSLDRYAYLPLTHAETRRIANVRVRLTDPRRETLVYNVIAALGVTTALNGDFTEMTQNLLTIENVTLPPAEIDGNSIAARFHRSIRWYIPNIQASLDEVNQAIRVDPGNPFLYLIRALGYQRSGDVAAARQDIAAARRLGAEDWISVLAIQFNDALYFKHDYEEALSYALPFAEQAPTSWYGQTMLGLSYYLLGDYAAAEAPLERAIALNPTLNFPYSFGISLALRQGNIALAQQLYRESLARFPDPTITERLVSVTLNPEAAQTAFVPLLEAFSNLALSQWREVIANTESLLTGDEQFADMYFLRGFAYCNLRDYATAAAEYTRGIELQPDYWLLYAMRAEVRRQGGDLIGAGLDASQVLQSPLGTALTPLLDVTISGELNCENFLTFDFTPYLTTPPAP
jgi:tetratricopeptide (TPR) repeat protein